jgi:polysaccharide export outer membrane protein
MRPFYFFLLAVFLFVFPVRSFAAQSDTSGFNTNDGTSTTSGEGAAAAGQTANAYPGFSDTADQAPSMTTSAFDKQDAIAATAVSNAVFLATQKAQAKRDAALSALMNKKTSFQTYVESSIGKSLDIFGRDLFQNVANTFAQLQTVQVNPDYVIGPGDALQVRGWGMVSIDINAIVNRNGQIYLPRVGAVQVSGVKYSNLEGYLKKAVGRVFKNFELSVSIKQTRNVQVYVVGHVLVPGSYTLSAMSTLMNALFVAGGPSLTGSMRNIQLKRSGVIFTSFDLYDILLHGDKSSDTVLQDGDVIYVSPVGPQFALFGDVKQPSIFELKQKVSLADVVRWAGGFESAAELKNVVVQKNIESQFQTVAELQAEGFAIDKNLGQIGVSPTDIIRVFVPGASPLEVKIPHEYVKVDGEVTNGGVFEITKGETIRSLVERIGGVKDDGYIFGTRLTREALRREQQDKIDKSIDRFERDVDANTKQRLMGDPTQAAVIQGEAESQRALVKKLRSIKADGRIILNLKGYEAKVSDLPDFPLKDGDRIYIPDKPVTIDVIGAVYQQNTFIYKPQRSVSEYVYLAGGVTPTGDKSELYRILADGTVKSNKHGGGGGSVNPGDAIVVPEKLIRGQSFLKSLSEFTSILWSWCSRSCHPENSVRGFIDALLTVTDYFNARNKKRRRDSSY